MAKDLFYSLDLNLLRTFLVLSQELNMRKASQRLHVSQPAISQTLQKLRHHFNDELFVKVPKGLAPTSFAEELTIAITPHLDGLASALNTAQPFDPKAIDSKLTIALSPMVLACLSGTLFRRLREQAPNAEIQLVNWTRLTESDISKGQTLMAVNYDLTSPKEIYLRQLIKLTGRVIVRKDHPIDKHIASPQDFSGLEIASFINPGWNDNHSVAANIMKRSGFDAKIGFRSEFLMALIDVVKNSDMYMPNSNLFPIEQFPDLRSIEIVTDAPEHSMPIYSHCHIKNRNNPLVLWLHEQIKLVLEQQVHDFDSFTSA